MILDLFLKLIDRCIDLARRREDQDRNFYTNFVTPAFEDFEALHKDYLESFHKYRTMLQNKKHRIDTNHPIIDEIHKDIVFGKGLNSKLSELLAESDHPILGDFIKAIYYYLIIAPEGMKSIEQAIPLIGLLVDDRLRFSIIFIDKIRNIKSELEKRRRVISLLDVIVSEMQTNYGRVIHEHANLKKRLLMPK